MASDSPSDGSSSGGAPTRSERTAVIATYSTRMEAEMAQRHLEEENIHAFITADDAGGMHPQLQQVQGVKLTGRSSEAADARNILEEAGALPQAARADEGARESDLYPGRSGRGLMPMGLGLAIILVAVVMVGTTQVGAVVGGILAGLGVILSLVGGLARWGKPRGTGRPEARA